MIALLLLVGIGWAEPRFNAKNENWAGQKPTTTNCWKDPEGLASGCWECGEDSGCRPVPVPNWAKMAMSDNPEPRVIWWADDVRIFKVEKYGVGYASQTAVLGLREDGSVIWKLVPWGAKERAAVLGAVR